MATKRTSLILTPADRKALADLQRLTGVSTVTDAIRLAIREAVAARRRAA